LSGGVLGRRQPEAVLDERLLARLIALYNRAELRQRDVDSSMIVRNSESK
jgi:hypothetical protein